MKHDRETLKALVTQLPALARDEKTLAALYMVQTGRYINPAVARQIVVTEHLAPEGAAVKRKGAPRYKRRDYGPIRVFAAEHGLGWNSSGIAKQWNRAYPERAIARSSLQRNMQVDEREWEKYIGPKKQSPQGPPGSSR
jgi:hypothetical protein